MKISDVQKFIKDELMKDPIFSTVDVVCADEQDSLAKVDTALGKVTAYTTGAGTVIGVALQAAANDELFEVALRTPITFAS